MKVLYFTDIHGNIEKYNRFHKIIKKEKPNIVINGGDTLSNKGHSFQLDFVKNEINKIWDFYEESEIPYLFILGNDDYAIIDNIIDEKIKDYKYIHNISFKKFQYNEFEFIGFNLVPDYPFRLKDRCRKDLSNSLLGFQFGNALFSKEPQSVKDIKYVINNGLYEIDDWFTYVQSLNTLEIELDNLVKPSDFSNSVYVCHCPPYGVNLGVCSNGIDVGSKAVTNFIKKYQPKLTLHGHIHESVIKTNNWFSEIGETISIQPGQLNKLNYVIINLDSMEKQFYSI